MEYGAEAKAKFRRLPYFPVPGAALRPFKLSGARGEGRVSLCLRRGSAAGVGAGVINPVYTAVGILALFFGDPSSTPGNDCLT